MRIYSVRQLHETHNNFDLPFNDLTQVFANEIQTIGNNNPWRWLHTRLKHNDISGIHLGDYIKFRFAIGEGPSLEYTARIHAIYKNKNGFLIDFWCDELLPDTIKWNDQLAAGGYQSYYYNSGPDGFPYHYSTIYSYLNALNGYVCYSVGYGTDSSNTNTYQKTLCYFKQEDFTQTGVWNYIPQDLKTYIVPKTGYCVYKGPVTSGDWIKSYSVHSYAYPKIRLDNLGNLWIPRSYDFYIPNISSYSANSNRMNVLFYPIYYMYLNNFNSNDTISMNHLNIFNNMNTEILSFLVYYDNLEYLTKYYPEYGVLYNRNNPNTNVQYWLADASPTTLLTKANTNVIGKQVEIYRNAGISEELYIPLCFTIG